MVVSNMFHKISNGTPAEHTTWHLPDASFQNQQLTNHLPVARTLLSGLQVKLQERENQMSPLHGTIVLDLTHMLSGPYGTMLLSDLGARTIKVEPPGQGEGTRALLADDPQP